MLTPTSCSPIQAPKIASSGRSNRFAPLPVIDESADVAGAGVLVVRQEGDQPTGMGGPESW